YDRGIPAFSSSRRNVAAVSFALLIVMFLGGWTVRIEQYPLTSWQMFSEYDDSGKVLYYRVYQTDEAGKTGIADLKKMLLGDNRYRATLKQAFVTREGREVAGRMLTRCATAWNRKATPGERVDEFRIVCRQWDFENQLDDPDLGEDTEWFKLDFHPREPSQPPTMTQSSIMPELPPAKNAGH
ncbi:MAG: hypothetical protein H0T11_04820, partial [Chthoniobacterales bacterium]|nr:hypothetical protein [Chthoniobacterales bacterium]